MQTFLPYPNFARSARVLDRQRLGKQRVETLQIMKALSDPGYGWQNHPAVKQWAGHESTLMDYQIAIIKEWRDRGYKDTCLDKTFAVYETICSRDQEPPWWIGNRSFHRSHRSNLLRKDPSHYRRLFEPKLSDELPYLWPQSAPGVFLTL